MKAAIYPGHGAPVLIESLPDPAPGPGEVLIRVARCGICGTDLSMTKGGAWDFAPDRSSGTSTLAKSSLSAALFQDLPWATG
ncbi:alcohol dehydrogenase catalytic domain-containing protein [Novosphingobium panipatense]|uniref:alcohol dehydrogenase catalytic domain-containing protein n=1 Tax=Novosphingobium panipatense TaxID=428991 RepID=UPI0036156BFA